MKIILYLNWMQLLTYNCIKIQVAKQMEGLVLMLSVHFRSDMKMLCTPLVSQRTMISLGVQQKLITVEIILTEIGELVVKNVP